MSWTYSDPVATDLRGLMDGFKAVFVKLQQVVQCYERVAQLTYGTTVRPSGEVSRFCLLRVTNGVGFTMANPTSPREGIELVLDIWNSSGGVMGAVTFGSEYVTTGAFTVPANGKHRLIRFYRTFDSKWREVYRSANDLS